MLIERIRTDCTGCTACAAACPRSCIMMEADENGFLYPTVDSEECIACGLCEKICPIISPRKMENTDPKAFAAYSRDEAVRMQSSSGGVFTELAKVILADNGAVFGAAYNEQFDVEHICVDADSNLEKLCGAKYSQSNLCGIFSEIKKKLDEGQRVLFSGTPCQVSGLKAYLRKDYENLLTVDVICHSVPSPVAWREYVRYRAKQDNGGELPQSINLRAKHTGWSRYQYSNLFRYKNGTEYSVHSGKNLYMKLFVGGYLSRESCADCRFKGYRRASDLTLGDFWGIWDINPEMDDNKGTSLILVQTQRGQDALKKNMGRMVIQQVSLDHVSAQNRAVLESYKMDPDRKKVLDSIRNGKFAECERCFNQSWLKPLPYWRKILHKVLGRE